MEDRIKELYGKIEQMVEELHVDFDVDEELSEEIYNALESFNEIKKKISQKP